MNALDTASDRAHRRRLARIPSLSARLGSRCVMFDDIVERFYPDMHVRPRRRADVPDASLALDT
jgi:hypothetical protein